MSTEMLALLFVLGCTLMLLVCLWLVMAGKRKAAGPRPKRERTPRAAREPKARKLARKEPEPEPEEVVERVRTRGLAQIASAARATEGEETSARNEMPPA
jgi:hypothetical protein